MKYLSRYFLERESVRGRFQSTAGGMDVNMKASIVQTRPIRLEYADRIESHVRTNRPTSFGVRQEHDRLALDHYEDVFDCAHVRGTVMEGRNWRLVCAKNIEGERGGAGLRSGASEGGWLAPMVDPPCSFGALLPAIWRCRAQSESIQTRRIPAGEAPAVYVGSHGVEGRIPSSDATEGEEPDTRFGAVPVETCQNIMV